jgi:hypothetical protein
MQERRMSHDDGRYKTADLYYAAYLKTAAVELLGTERDGDRTMFVFTKPDNIRDLKNQFFTRRARVAAMTYADEIKALKTLTHMED